ncbi:hypothetical protein DMB44_04425 [Thermoplasma sp. Kam2015]|uniref:hypothetical protein n=1 Tax=Thermoplasma sp. Kam2015 TaxID=2094122 RepID=UPI000D8B23F2|nr:hypothetical protein [Thermoplasma sp. Kam2015]PYB68296.1 hypothetical protein DMB44_04425 [Thermoplasma sp. Kam2015]
MSCGLGKMERGILQTAWELAAKDPAHPAVSIDDIRRKLAKRAGKVDKVSTEQEFEKWLKEENIPPDEVAILRKIRASSLGKARTNEWPSNSFSSSFYRSLGKLYELGLYHYSPPDYRDLEKYYKGRRCAYFD